MINRKARKPSTQFLSLVSQSNIKLKADLSKVTNTLGELVSSAIKVHVSRRLSPEENTQLSADITKILKTCLSSLLMLGLMYSPSMERPKTSTLSRRK